MPDFNAEAEAQRRFGITLNGSGRSREWHCACPFCHDGKDRFIIWAEGNYYCRVCGKKGWLNEDNKKWKPPDDWQKQLEERTRQLEVERCQKLQRWQNRFNKGLIWKWHDNMPEAARAQWLKWGVSEDAIETYALGYRAHKAIETPKGVMTLPAYTIPVTRPVTGDVVNVQYRLVVPPAADIGKYRQERDIPAAAFYASAVMEGAVIVVEGAKKAIVVAERISYALPVVGMPSNVPHQNLLKELDCFSEVYLAFDPWSDKQVVRAVAHIGKRARVLKLPGKPDDLFVENGWSAESFMRYLKYARKEL